LRVHTKPLMTIIARKAAAQSGPWDAPTPPRRGRNYPSGPESRPGGCLPRRLYRRARPAWCRLQDRAGLGERTEDRRRSFCVTGSVTTRTVVTRYSASAARTKAWSGHGNGVHHGVHPRTTTVRRPPLAEVDRVQLSHGRVRAIRRADRVGRGTVLLVIGRAARHSLVAGTTGGLRAVNAATQPRNRSPEVSDSPGACQILPDSSPTSYPRG
jgi:hypothetical protein